jgi:hypothetical protein
MTLQRAVTIARERRRKDLHERRISNWLQQVPCHSEKCSGSGLITRWRAAALALVVCAWVSPVRAQDAESPSTASPSVPRPGAEDRDLSEQRGKKKEKEGDTSARSDDDFDARSSVPMTVGARLMAGVEWQSASPAGGQTDPAQEEYGFTVRQIRLRVKGDLAELFRVNVSFDLADALDENPGVDQPLYVRTATLEYRPWRELRVQVGRFKRPFSHLELESASDLPILRRGLFNGLAIEDNQWGDRAIGVMASGRFKAPKLRWYLSLTNPNWSTSLPTEGVDVMGRVEWTIVKGLVLGANAGYKRMTIGDDELDDFAYGGDVSLKLGDARFLLESNDAALPFETGRPRGRGVLFLFDYELELSPSLALQPTFFAEYADADTDVSQNESLRLVFALNLLAFSGFRIMPQVDIVRSIGDTSDANPWLESEALSLIFSLVL